MDAYVVYSVDRYITCTSITLRYLSCNLSLSWGDILFHIRCLIYIAVLGLRLILLKIILICGSNYFVLIFFWYTTAVINDKQFTWTSTQSTNRSYPWLCRPKAILWYLFIKYKPLLAVFTTMACIVNEKEDLSSMTQRNNVLFIILLRFFFSLQIFFNKVWLLKLCLLIPLKKDLFVVQKFILMIL